MCKRKRRTDRLVRIVLCLLLACASVAAVGREVSQPACEQGSSLRGRGTFNLRVDNDLFGGVGQDEGYTNGFLLSWVSPNLLHFRHDPCLPPIVRGLNRYLSFLQPGGFDEQNMFIGLGQLMFTPADRAASTLLPDDRPYAGALMLSLGYNAREDETLRTSLFRFGVVGPASGAKRAQDWWHGVIGVDRFQGWSHQLHNEPVVQLIHERRRRVLRDADGSGWGHDLTAHVGASLGNFATYGNAGAEWRYGLRLPDDFGTAPLRPGGENTAPVHELRGSDWSGHFFIAVDARWVLRDITLDGNTFRSSHSVDKRHLVADAGYGVAVYKGRWRLAFARYHRTREFHGQRSRPIYGTVTVGRRF